jgi:hypothetical protein
MERTITVPARENKPFKYKGYVVTPRKETGWLPEEDNYGFWVVKGGCNIMPGACWFHTVSEAIKGIEKLELAKGDADLFWLLMGQAGLTTSTKLENAPNFRVGGFKVESSYSDSVSVHGRGGNAKLNLRFKNLKLELTPTDALAIAAILKEGAAITLGKVF